MRISHPEPFGSAWLGKWIWDEPPAIHAETATRPVLSNAEDHVALFRREFMLNDVPPSAPCRFWADGRLVLFANGQEVARGPVRSDPRRAHYDVVDLAEHLHKGNNVLAAIVRHFGDATSWWMPVPPTYTLGAGSFVFEAKLGDEWVVSDEQWLARPGLAWKPISMPGDVGSLPIESFDACRYPFGWNEVDFEGDSFKPATVIAAVNTGGQMTSSPPSEPFGQLLPPVRTSMPTGDQRYPMARAARRVDAVDDNDPVRRVLESERAGLASDGEDQLLRFDFGEVVVGTVVLEIRGLPKNTVIDVAGAEQIDDEGRLAPLGQHTGFRYCADGEDRRFETLEILGFRYLDLVISGTATAVDEDMVEVFVQERHRLRPAGASFESSDPVINDIFEVGLRTVDLCALDAYVDCPTREQRAWTGDSVVHQMVDLVANPDRAMAIWHPQLAASPRPDGMLAMAPASDFEADDRTIVPDWSLHWVRSLRNVWWWTERADVVESLLPVAERALRWFESYLGDDGLLHDVTGWVLLDWSSVYPHGTSSTLNALWARGLEDLAEMSRWFGNDGTARWAEGRLDDVRSNFDVFYDPERTVYVDHLVEGVRQVPAAQHGGATALAAGLVPEGRRDAVIDRLVDRTRLVRHSFVMDPVTVTGGSTGYVHLVTGYPAPEWDAKDQMVECQPFFRYVLHDGLARAGRADLIEGLCRDWTYFLEKGLRTWPECWQGGTLCHGWSSTPTRDLVLYTLGIEPSSPGFESVRIAPNLGSLEWATAIVPTPHGPLRVEAHRGGRLEVESPVPITP
jgi:alpha-L-rhamnosidase